MLDMYFSSGITKVYLSTVDGDRSEHMTLELYLFKYSSISVSGIRAPRLLHGTGVIYDGVERSDTTHLIALVTITFYTHHLTMKWLHNKSLLHCHFPVNCLYRINMAAEAAAS